MTDTVRTISTYDCPLVFRPLARDIPGVQDWYDYIGPKLDQMVAEGKTTQRNAILGTQGPDEWVYIRTWRDEAAAQEFSAYADLKRGHRLISRIVEPIVPAEPT
jgi:hypothetical protein